MAELRKLFLAEFLGDLPDRPEESLVRSFERVMCVGRYVHQDVRSESDQEKRNEVFAPVAGPDPEYCDEQSGHEDRVREALGVIAEAVLEPGFILVPEWLLFLELSLLGPAILLHSERQVGPGSAEAEEEREPEDCLEDLPRRRLGHCVEDVRADMGRDRTEGESRNRMGLNFHGQYSVG